MDRELHIIIHNVRSAHNVGSIFRTCDGAGVRKIHLTGYTPSPHDPCEEPYSTQAQNKLAKTALGAQDQVDWEKTEDISVVLEKYKKSGYHVLALEKIDGAHDLFRFEPEFPSVLVLGNETDGIDGRVMEQCEAVLTIPMRGRKESLNVSVAAGIAIYQILR